MVWYPKWKWTLKEAIAWVTKYILYVWRLAVFSFVLWFTQDSITTSYFSCLSCIMNKSKRRKVLFCFSSLVFPNRIFVFLNSLLYFLLAVHITFCFVSRTNAFVWRLAFNGIQHFIWLLLLFVMSLLFNCFWRLKFDEKIFYFASDWKILNENTNQLHISFGLQTQKG